MSRRKEKLKQQLNTARAAYEQAAIAYLATIVGRKVSLNELTLLRRAKEQTEREYVRLLARWAERRDL
jgi:hypothetical protein